MRNNPGLNETELINTKRAVIILAAAFILGALALTGYGLYYDEISEDSDSLFERGLARSTYQYYLAHK